MLVSLLPYALAPTAFRFPALAGLAGRAPLGGQREVVLAVYLGARLAHDALPERGVAQPLRAERAANARGWLSTMALPAAVRPSLAALLDASASGVDVVAPAVRAVIAATGSYLDPASLGELAQLATGLDAR